MPPVELEELGLGLYQGRLCKPHDRAKRCPGSCILGGFRVESPLASSFKGDKEMNLLETFRHETFPLSLGAESSLCHTISGIIIW
jgi:hypothetical protein